MSSIKRQQRPQSIRHRDSATNNSGIWFENVNSRQQSINKANSLNNSPITVQQTSSVLGLQYSPRNIYHHEETTQSVNF